MLFLVGRPIVLEVFSLLLVTPASLVLFFISVIFIFLREMPTLLRIIQLVGLLSSFFEECVSHSHELFNIYPWTYAGFDPSSCNLLLQLYMLGVFIKKNKNKKGKSWKKFSPSLLFFSWLIQQYFLNRRGCGANIINTRIKLTLKKITTLTNFHSPIVSLLHNWISNGNNNVS